MKLLNLAWPALYYMRGFWSTWYVIILTLVIEIFLTKWFLKSGYLRTSMAVASSNLVSATAGIYLVMWGMFYYWHPIMDGKMPNATFDIRNWIATWAFLWIVSSIIEGFIIKLFFWKEYTIAKIISLSVLINLISYLATIFIINYQ